MTSHVLTSPDGLITIEWECGFRNPATDSSYLRLATAVEEPDTKVRIMYALIIANTRKITFTYKDGVAPPEPIAQFEQFWGWAENMIYIQDGGVNVALVDNNALLKASYPLFNRLVCNPLQESWGEAYNKAQVLFPARSVFKPDSSLPPEVLADENFLALVAKRLEASGLGVLNKPSP